MGSTLKLPDFLGIGAPRCGTTWLHWILHSHPQVFVPEHRKELAFFCGTNWSRGLEWYSGFFASARSDQIVGEITPAYMRREEAPRRIRDVVPSCKFLVMLRNPVDRTFSQYTAQHANHLGLSFEDYVSERGGAIKASRYAEQLARYLDVFDRNRFLFIVLEHATRMPDQLNSELAGFLGVDSAGFSVRQIGPRNRSRVVRLPRVYKSLRRAGKRLRDFGLNAPVEAVKKMKVFHVLMDAPEATPPAIRPETRRLLWSRYFERDTADLERLTGIDLSLWRPKSVERYR